MRLMDRIHGQGAEQRKDQLMCPLCGQSGPPAESADSGLAAFALRGELGGHPVRKCFVCGAGFVVNGNNTEPLPSGRWSEIEAEYERQHPGAW